MLANITNIYFLIWYYVWIKVHYVSYSNCSNFLTWQILIFSIRRVSVGVILNNPFFQINQYLKIFLENDVCFGEKVSSQPYNSTEENQIQPHHCMYHHAIKGSNQKNKKQLLVSSWYHTKHECRFGDAMDNQFHLKKASFIYIKNTNSFQSR